MGASDIHIEPQPGKDKTVIRLRKDGSLLNYIEVPATYRNAMITRLKIMCDLDISEKRKPQDGKIKFKKYGPLDIELRVATIPSQGGVEDVVMRILAAGEPIPLDNMGFSARNLELVKKTISKPYGLFFVCGPTGSGKTTTLHSILKYINTPDTKIWTVEDPVEITQKGLRQVQVNKKAGLDFATIMRSFLRADPGRDHGRRNARQGNRLHRHRGLAHRPPGVRHPAHQQRAGIHHPPARHGHGPVQLRRCPARHSGAASGQAPVQGLQESAHRVAGRDQSAAHRICRGNAQHRDLEKRSQCRIQGAVCGVGQTVRRRQRPDHACTKKWVAKNVPAPAIAGASACTNC